MTLTPDPKQHQSEDQGNTTVVYKQGEAPRHQNYLWFEEVAPKANYLRAGDKTDLGLQDGSFQGKLGNGDYAAMALDIGYKYTVPLPTKDSPPQPLVNEDGIFKLEYKGKIYMAVADGLGGHHAGEFATRVFLESLYSNLNLGMKPLLAIDFAAKSLELEHLKNPYTVHGEPTDTMATCFCLAKIAKVHGEKRVTFYHVGDCKGIVSMPGSEIVSTVDHTLAQDMRTDRSSPEFKDHNRKLMKVIGLKEGVLSKDNYGEPVKAKKTGPFPLPPGSHVGVFTDAVTDNFGRALERKMLKIIDHSVALAENALNRDSSVEIVDSIYNLVKNKINKGRGKRDNIAIGFISVK